MGGRRYHQHLFLRHLHHNHLHHHHHHHNSRGSYPEKCSGPRADIEDLTSKIQPVAIDNKYVIKSFRVDSHSIRKDIHFRDPSWDGRVRAQDVAKRQPAWQRKCLWQSQPSQTNNIPTSTHILLLWTSSYITMLSMIFITTSTPDGSCDQQHSNTHAHPLTSWSQVGDI